MNPNNPVAAMPVGPTSQVTVHERFDHDKPSDLQFDGRSVVRVPSSMIEQTAEIWLV